MIAYGEQSEPHNKALHLSINAVLVKNNNNDKNDGSNNNDTNSGELVNGMRPEFKEAMDSYEEFFDEYCAFMKEYNSSSNTASMLGEYRSFILHYTETMTKLNAICSL